MKVYALMIAASLVGLPLAVGCDREIEHKEKVEVKEDGTVKKQSETVKETPSGDIVKEEKKTVDRPD